VSDIASVSQQAVTPIESYSIVDGNPAVIVQVTGSFDQRIDQYVSRANEVVEDFKKGLPEEIVVSSIYEESLYVEKRFDELTSSIGFALFLVLALSAFLLGLRSAILVALILPLTLCSVLFICQITGLPLHQTSTTGMIIALGLLIDNAIIVVEDYRYRRLDGLGSKQAIYKSVKHLFMPLLAATATTALAFMPIAVGEGPSNEFVGGMAKTLIMAVTSSLFLSLTVVLPTLQSLEKMPFLSSDI
jgi:Cation/multidrug efflux pump